MSVERLGGGGVAATCTISWRCHVGVATTFRFGGAAVAVAFTFCGSNFYSGRWQLVEIRGGGVNCANLYGNRR